MIVGDLDIVRDNLVLHLDTININCHPRSGSNIYNLANTSEVGSLVNGSYFDTINGSIIVDGIDDYISFPNIGSGFNPDGLSNYSISTWIKNNNDNTGGLIAWYNSVSEGDDGFELEISGGTIYFAFSSSIYAYYNYNITDTWVNLSIVYNGNLIGNSNRLKIYINGQLITLTYSGNIPNIINANIEILTIGLIRTATGNRYIEGNFSHLLTYNDSLTYNQVLQNYQATKYWFQ